MSLYFVRSFYCFHPLTPSQVEELATLVRQKGAEHGILGLVLVAGEGCNASISGTAEALDAFSDIVREYLGISDLNHKDTVAEGHPFPRLKVVAKEEIVTSGAPRVFLPEGSG